MAFPAALFIKRYSYKAGILVGLGLYASGALLFIPGSLMGVFWPFLVAYFTLTCGLSFLETSANPYILAMGSEESSTQRLNLAAWIRQPLRSEGPWEPSSWPHSLLRTWR